MSNNNWNSKQTSLKLETVSLAHKIKVNIPEELLDKIKFLCKLISRVEWSGVLFYSIEGTITKPDKMVITLKDILLMDKGTKAYTSFDWDDSIVAYQMDNPESLDWTIGHIHSHNDMNVYFSGTDWSELNDNCPQHNFYLSVIVNNYLDIVAKIAFTAEPKIFSCKTENGKDYTLSLTEADISPFMFVYDCDIIMPDSKLNVPKSFIDRYKHIEDMAIEREKKAEEARKRQAATDAAKKTVVKGDFIGGESRVKSSFPDYDPKNRNHSRQLSKFLYDDFQREFEAENDLSENDFFTQQTIEQEFATYVLRLGNDEIEDDELVDALEDIEGSNLNIQSLSASILQSYGAYYERFFDKLPDYHGDKAFLETLEEVIGIYEEYEEDYKFLTTIVEGLKELGIKFENFSKIQTEHGK